jgi:Uma2 family endonuclease
VLSCCCLGAAERIVGESHREERPMTGQQEPHFTLEEYLELELVSEERHEYLDGRIYAMSGGSGKHAQLCMNVSGQLYAQLRGRPCRAFGEGLKVRVEKTGLHTYPDASALCGEPRFAGKHEEILLNPSVLVEVLSPSTERYDRDDKFWHYRQIPSLQEYVLVAQDWLHVERFTRDPANGARWVLAEASGPDGEADLPSIGCVLRLRDVYEHVDVPPTRPLRIVREPEAAEAYTA